MSPFNKFLTNISWNVLGKIIVQGLLFALSIVITRYLGKERLGIYASILVIPAFIRLINSFGLETVANKKLPELRVRDESLAQGRYLLRRLLALRLATALAFCGLLYVGLPVYLDWVSLPELIHYRWPIIIYFLVITVNSLLSTVFMAYLQYKVTAVVEGVSALLNLLLLVAFVRLDWGITGVLLAYVFATAITIVVYLFLARSWLVGQEQKTGWAEAQRLAWISYVMGIFSFGLLTQSDIVLMNYFGVATERVGYYHLAIGVSAMLTFVLNGIGPLAFSIFSETHAREGEAGLQKSWLEIIGFIMFCTAPVYLFALFNAEPLLTFIYGQEFKAAGIVMTCYLAFLIAQLALGGGVGALTLHVLQKSQVALRATIEGSVLNIALNLVLIPQYAELGAVGATGFSMVYMAGRMMLALLKTLDLTPIFRFAGKCFLLAAIPVIPVELLAAFWMDHLIPNFILYAITLLAVLAGAKPLNQDHIKILSGIHPLIPKALKWFVRGPK